MSIDYIEIAASGTRSNDYISQDYQNFNHRGLVLTLDVGAIASGSLVPTIEGKDRISQKYYTILASAPILASSTKVLKVYPGITASTNLSVSDILPETWRVKVVAASGIADYTVGASLVD